MKTTKSMILIAAALSFGLASTASALPRSKQFGPPTSQSKASRDSFGSCGHKTGETRHLKTGPKSKRIGG